MISTIMNWLVPKAHAAMTWNFLTVSETAGGTGTTGLTSIADKIITWASLIAGILAVLFLIYSGILYITAGGNPDSAKKGQQGIINAIIGIVIITIAYFLATTIAHFAGTATTP